MMVLVTGGTGLVGSHSVKATVDAEQDLRRLVRSPGRLARALEPLGVRGVEYVVGDATDADLVRRAMDGCDAVVHAAAIFSMTPARPAICGA
jgi:dihydroflavonol-4-reductase